MGASFDWAVEEFGLENVLGFSLHLDEYSPQLQVLVTPVTPDGRLSQKDFFKSPNDLRRQHKVLREHMAAAGYDVETRVTERSREHLSSSEFQAMADRLRDAAADAEAEKATYETMRVSLKNRSTNLDRRETSVSVREAELAAALQEAQQVQATATAARRAAVAVQVAAQRARQEAEQERDQLRAMNERLLHVPPEFEAWLDRRKSNGEPLRHVFESDMARRRAARAEVQRLMDATPKTTTAARPEAEL